jgi:hypothetical protein
MNWTVASRLRSGDWVEVRSKEEILRSLDKNGRLEGLPFMPQMFQYCGRRFRVYKRAHKTCDTVSGNWVSRKLSDGVHLDLRCDGQAYGGCQAACLIFWKEAWLKPVIQQKNSTESSSRADSVRHSASPNESSCTEEDVWRGARTEGESSTRYICQATELLKFTGALPWYNLKQYLEDYSSGNASLARIFRAFVYVTYYYGSLAYRRRLGRPGRWLYDRLQALWGGVPFPRRSGTIPVGQPMPTRTLNLQPGELVRVKPFQEILATIDANGHHRGLGFDADMVPYCGGNYRVKARVHNFIDEKTGEMKTLKTPAVILEGAFCQSRYSNCRMLCPRSIYSWWREIWLERVPESANRRDSSLASN